MSDTADIAVSSPPEAPDASAAPGKGRDVASRKWQLTFNNPKDHGWTHEKIREVLRTFKTLCYWCMADEIGGEQQTYHTHLFFNLAPSNCRFSTFGGLAGPDRNLHLRENWFRKNPVRHGVVWLSKLLSCHGLPAPFRYL